ncbi:Trk system potassium uptake protein trkA homolog 1 K(+)-uptake protein trkA homolog 1 [Proteiniborus sp. DW1]|uniref:Trk system potassium transporter TrkA n=1 Tax=Proteiniborus sp. DW1 TaxID=1889883 RepID=UPI00092E0F31|nr:Trk system potassium transporter TrkA [Proteiniborus sp. DW1]SCG83279.1 Trk system potassium uptake protein trkA homolog 1 K(+)-uptake protein trkA homolog 1 [Proteiniborus sp. DW1]
MHIIIVGAGKLGYILAEFLSQNDNNVVMIDNNEKTLERANNQFDILTYKGNGAQMSVLEGFNIKNADLLIATTDNDDTNMLICYLAKKMGCKRVVARIRDPEYSDQVDTLKKQLDIDYAVNPELVMAKEIGAHLLKGQALNMEDFAKGKVSIVNYKVNELEGMEGKKIKDINIPKSVLIAAILRDGEVIIPYGDTLLHDNDTIYLIGEKESIGMFKSKRESLEHNIVVKKVMILGGGNAAYYLAKKLLKNGIFVKIIEKDEGRCGFLAQELPGALIIHGDATDPYLLTEENISEVDALVSLTGFDEENLLMTLLAKKYGVGKVITKVSRSNYIPIIEQLGINNAINPVMITAGEIMRFIQGGRVVSLFLLLGGKAEVLELIAKENSKIVGKPLAELGLPKGIIIGSIVQNGKVIIPNGDSIINPGDRLIVFCLQSEVMTLEKMFYKAKGGFIDELWHRYKGFRKSSSN